MLKRPPCTGPGVAAVASFSTNVVPPNVDQPAVVPYSRSPLPARLDGFATHLPALQNPLQSASAAHVVRQVMPSAAQWNAPHDVPTPVTHTPAPSHIDAAMAVDVVVLQAGSPQTVVAGHLRHAPAPLQKPSVPHEVWLCAMHSLRGSLSGAAAMHAPTLPVAAHV